MRKPAAMSVSHVATIVCLTDTLFLFSYFTFCFLAERLLSTYLTRFSIEWDLLREELQV